MARLHPTLATALETSRRLRQGRGNGYGPDYKTWIQISDFRSKGRRHRIHSIKFKRTLHLLSDLERSAFFESEYRGEVVENREQYPLLPISKTQQLASELKVDHPRPYGSSVDCVMTTDQVWTLQNSNNSCLLPVIVKYSDDLEDSRTTEKIAIEWEYWVDTYNKVLPRIFTECDVSLNFDQNWDFIRATLAPGYFASFHPYITDLVNEALFSELKSSSLKLGSLIDLGAKRLSLQREEILPAIHFNIATGRWPVDLSRNPLIPSRILYLKGER